MGNFKHQSSRATDRDRDRERDRDGDKERERDIRDKEGQERLRHVSFIPLLLSMCLYSRSYRTNMTVIDCFPCQVQETRKGMQLPILIPVIRGVSRLHPQMVLLDGGRLAKLPRKKSARLVKIGEEVHMPRI